MPIPIWSNMSKIVRIIIASGIVLGFLIVIVFLGLSGDLFSTIQMLLDCYKDKPKL